MPRGRHFPRKPVGLSGIQKESMGNGGDSELTKPSVGEEGEGESLDGGSLEEQGGSSSSEENPTTDGAVIPQTLTEKPEEEEPSPELPYCETSNSQYISGMCLAGDEENGTAVPGWKIYSSKGTPIVIDGKIRFITSDEHWIAENNKHFKVKKGDKFRVNVDELGSSFGEVQFVLWTKLTLLGVFEPREFNFKKVSDGVYEVTITIDSDEAWLWIADPAKKAKPGKDWVEYKKLTMEKV